MSTTQIIHKATAKTPTSVKHFCQDKDGKWKIIQTPNFLLSAWIILLLLNHAAHNQNLSHLQSAVIFTWAYLELTQGDSNFRKLLGAIVLAAVTFSFFK